MDTQAAHHYPTPTMLPLPILFVVTLIWSAPVTGQQGPLSSGPLFIENQGQWSDDVRLVGRVGGVTAVLQESGWLVGLERRKTGVRLPAPRSASESPFTAEVEGAAVSMTFEASQPVSPVGNERHPTYFNFFCSNDRSRWRSYVPSWKAARYEDLYHGVDVLVHTREGVLEYDVLVEPDADLDTVQIKCEGIHGLEVAADGALLMRTPLGVVRQSRPRTWEVDGSGDKRPVECRYRLLDDHRFGFSVEGRDLGAHLVVDPGIIWSGQLGGFSGYDSIEDVLVRPTGDILVTGTVANDFPTTLGAYNTTPSATGVFLGNAFVALVSANGTGMTFATFLGEGRGYALTLDGGDIVLAGLATPGFPISPNGFQTLPGGGGFDAFVARLDATGSALMASTYLGGFLGEVCRAVAVAPGGDIVVAGDTDSPDFPTTPGAFMTQFNQGNLIGGGTIARDPFVVRLDAALTTTQYATFVGSSAADECWDMVLDPSGAPILVGMTLGMFPTTPLALQPNPLGAHDGFVAALDPTGSTQTFATYLGGNDADYAYGAALSTSGEVVVVGSTQSLDFPTTPGAWDTTHNGPVNPAGQFGVGSDGFLARLDLQAPALVWSSYLGGNGEDRLDSVSLDASDVVTVGGWTNSMNYPVTAGAYQVVPSAWSDTVVARLDPSATSLHYATYLGGSWTEDLRGMDLSPAGDVVVSGSTWSPDFPITPGSPSTTYNATGCSPFGGSAPCSDAFLARLDLLPTGVSRFGAATVGCGPGMPISVSGLPLATNPSFAITCSGAPPGTSGALFIGAAPDLAGTLTSGVQAHVLLTAPWFALPTNTDARGWSTVAIPIPSGLTGMTFAAQFGWDNTATCGGAGTLSASNALLVTVQ